MSLGRVWIRWSTPLSMIFQLYLDGQFSWCQTPIEKSLSSATQWSIYHIRLYLKFVALRVKIRVVLLFFRSAMFYIYRSLFNRTFRLMILSYLTYFILIRCNISCLNKIRAYQIDTRQWCPIAQILFSAMSTISFFLWHSETVANFHLYTTCLFTWCIPCIVILIVLNIAEIVILGRQTIIYQSVNNNTNITKSYRPINVMQYFAALLHE